MQGIHITPPYGYDEIVPLQKSHRVLLRPGATPEFCRAIHALASSYTEFVAARRDYPIVLTSGDNGATVAPVVVLGLALGQNLFLNAQGDWDPSAYVPAFVRRYPFCISKLYVDGVPRGERIVCVARAQVRGLGREETAEVHQHPGGTPALPAGAAWGGVRAGDREQLSESRSRP